MPGPSRRPYQSSCWGNSFAQVLVKAGQRAGQQAGMRYRDLFDRELEELVLYKKAGSGLYTKRIFRDHITAAFLRVCLAELDREEPQLLRAYVARAERNTQERRAQAEDDAIYERSEDELRENER